MLFIMFFARPMSRAKYASFLNPAFLHAIFKLRNKEKLCNRMWCEVMQCFLDSYQGSMYSLFETTPSLESPVLGVDDLPRTKEIVNLPVVWW